MSAKLIIAAVALGGQAVAANAITSAPAATTTDPCQSVFEGCVQSGMTMLGGPNFAACGASSDACVNALKTAMPTTTMTSAPTAATTSDPCSSVYNSCVQSGIANDPLGPNFAACGASSESCVNAHKTAMPTTIMTSAPAYSTANPCSSVFNSCVQSGIANDPLGPNFAACGASSESCLASLSMMKTSLAADKPAYTTEVVTAYTTYCPYATTISVNPSKTYTVTMPTTLTITDCPCTVTKPYSTQPIVAHPTSSPVVVSHATSSSMIVAPTTTGGAMISPSKSTAVVVGPMMSSASVITVSKAPYTSSKPAVVAYTPTSSPVAQFTGAAVKTSLEVGSLFAAALAFIL